MSNYKLTIQYEGTRYKGWQRQINTDLTIQGKLEAILSVLYEMPVEIDGSGRTDAGVHALAQTATFQVAQKYARFSCQQILDYCNQYLPLDIRVLSVEPAPERFHARLSAKGKQYDYLIDLHPQADVFWRRFSYHPEDQRLDLESMKKAALVFLGSHDFKSFCGNKRMKKSTIRTIWSIDFTLKDSMLTISYRGDGFLQNMVRILTGTLLEVGMRERTPESMVALLDSKDRSAAGFLSPAHGLFLKEVFYH